MTGGIYNLPLALLLSAWVKMQTQMIPKKRERTEEEWGRIINGLVIYTRTFLLAFQNAKDEKEKDRITKKYVEGMNEISRMV